MVICPRCQAALASDAKKCPTCGAELVFGPRRISGFEWKSPFQIFGWPLVHIAAGYIPGTRRPLVARGIIAIGQFAVGVVTLAQFGIGLLCGLGQLMVGWYAVGQFAAGVEFGLGQFATGRTAIGQVAAGEYVLAVQGVGRHCWTKDHKDPYAKEHFDNLWASLESRLPK